MEQPAIVIGWKLALALVAGSSTLTTLAIYLLARFTHVLDAYAGERAKLLAQFHNLDKLLEQTKMLTATTETIKARVSDELWDRQMRLNLRRDFYVRLMEDVSGVFYMVSSFAGFRQFAVEAKSDPQTDQQKVNAELAQRLDEIVGRHRTIMQSVAVASLFLRSDVHNQLQLVTSNLSRLVMNRSAPQEDLDLVVNEFGCLMQKLIETARADLGFPPLSPPLTH
jgi:hypothetical protein